MQLARDVTGPGHSVLLAAGTELTAQHLKSLKSWKIHSIHVQGQGDPAPADPTAALPPEVRKQLEERLNRRLKLIGPDTPGFGRLRTIALHRAAQQPPER